MSNKKSWTMKNMVLEEFIEIYRSEPCLWLMKDKDYHDRNKKEAAYAKLVLKLREIEPDAVKDTVVKKINNLRSAVRKERKKVKASKKSGASAADVYKPALWYYDLLGFLENQDAPDTSNLDGPGNESDEDDVQEASAQKRQRYDSTDELSDSNELSTPGRPSQEERIPIQLARLKRKKNDDLTSDVLTSVRGHFETPQLQEDRYDLFAKTVAVKLRNLEKRQSLVAEKMINDLLFEAEMGTLTLPSHSQKSAQQLL